MAWDRERVGGSLTLLGAALAGTGLVLLAIRAIIWFLALALAWQVASGILAAGVVLYVVGAVLRRR